GRPRPLPTPCPAQALSARSTSSWPRPWPRRGSSTTATTWRRSAPVSLAVPKNGDRSGTASKKLTEELEGRPFGSKPLGAFGLFLRLLAFLAAILFLSRDPGQLPSSRSHRFWSVNRSIEAVRNVTDP